MKKKLLSLITVILVLTMFALAFIACQKYGEEDNDSDTTEVTPTYTHTVPNGTFYNASSTASGNDAKLLDSVNSWSQMSAGTTTANSEKTGIVNAAITLDENTFSDLATKYFRVYEDAEGHALTGFTMAYPGLDPKTPEVNVTDKDGNVVYNGDGTAQKKLEDSNVYVIANTKNVGSLYATTSSFTLEKDSYYLLQFSVCSKIDAEEGNKTKGAWFRLSGDMNYQIGSINTNGEWKTYYLFIETNKYSSMSLTAQIWLGYGPAVSTETTYATDGKDIYATRGVAFFDNVLCEKVDLADLTTTIKDEGLATYGAYTYSEDAIDPENFASFKANLAATSDGAGYKYVTAKSAYYLSNTDMSLRSNVTSYGTSYRRYFYTFRERNASNNLQKYSLSSSGTLDTKYYGSVDLSKLYDVTAATDTSTYQDNYTKSTSLGGIGTSAGFNAMTYTEWYDGVMHATNHNVSELDESFALMIYNKDLMANALKTSEKIKVEPNTYYEIGVWAYVWGKQFEGSDGKKHYYDTYSATTKPSDPYETKFTAVNKQIYDLIHDNNDVDGSAFHAYTEMSAEDKTKAEGYAAALTAMGTLVYGSDNDSFNTVKTNETKWLRTLLYGDESSTKDVSSLCEKFYYAYLTNNAAELPTAYAAEDVQNAIATLYQYERKQNVETYEGLVKQIETYEDEMATYDQAVADYEQKYKNWEEAHGGVDNAKPQATVKLTGAGDIEEKTTTSVGEWQLITFYVQGSQLSQRQLTLEMCLGTGSDETTYMIGGVFFDNVYVKEYAEVSDPENYARISEIKEENQLAYGGVTVAENTVPADDWKVSTATGTASTDKDNVTLTVEKNDLGNIKLGGTTYDMFAVSMENKVPTASILDYTGESVVEVLPNKFYRFAFLLKTEGVDEDLGVSVILMTGESKDDVTTSKNTTVSAYTSDDWSEIVYYIKGDLVKTYYVGIRVTMGSGTRYTSDSYVQGKVYVTAFNALEIDYDEYNSASTGDKIVSGVSLYNITSTLDSATNKFTNAYYADVNYSSTKSEEFDDEGKLTGIATTKSWTIDTIVSNSYDAPADVKLIDVTTSPKLTWSKVDAVAENATKDGATEKDATTYEIWMKYTDDDNKSQEKLYKVVRNNDSSVTYDAAEETFTYGFTESDWNTKKLTTFAVKAVGTDGASVLSSYTASSLGSTAGTVIPADAIATGDAAQSEAKAGTVLAKEVFGDGAVVNGVDYVSPYPTVMKLTSNYDSVLSIHSETLATGLSADSYYKISVWAKTMGDTEASITLGGTSGALQAGNELGFVQVNTAGEWQEYCFFVKTGNFTTKMYVKYSIGTPYAVAKTKDSHKYYAADDMSKGTVYFDAVTVTSITENEFDNAKELNDTKDATVKYASANHDIVYEGLKYNVFIMEYVMDSFDASESPNTSSTTTNNTKGNTPSNYNHGYDKDLETDGMYSMYGVYDVRSEDATMMTAIEQLYKYNDTTDTKEDVFVYNDIFAKLLDKEPYDWAEMGDDEWKTFLRTFLHINRETADGTVDGGDNVLVMSNKKNSGYAQNYAIDSTYNYTANANTVTKLTFSAKTLIARVIATATTADDGTTNYTYDYALDKAFGELRVTPTSSSDDTVSVKINSNVYGEEGTFCDDVTYTVYLYNPTDDANTISWTFYLGDEEAEEGKETAFSQYLVGLMAIDLVSVEDVTDDWTKESFETATNGAASIDGTNYYYTYKEKEEEKTPDEDNTDTNKEEEKESFWDRIFNNEYFWLYISSFVIALIILITVIVILVRKWKKKHPKEEVVENNVKTESDLPKPIPTESKEKEDALESDDYTDEIKPNYVQRVNKNKSRKDRKNGKK